MSTAYDQYRHALVLPAPKRGVKVDNGWMLATVIANMYLLYMTAAQPHELPHQAEVTVTDARAKLPELLATEIRDGGVVYLTRYGRRVGAVVPAEVAERFEQWEDAYWSRRAAEVLHRDEPAVPWEQAVAELEAGDAGTGARTR